MFTSFSIWILCFLIRYNTLIKTCLQNWSNDSINSHRFHHSNFFLNEYFYYIIFSKLIIITFSQSNTLCQLNLTKQLFLQFYIVITYHKLNPENNSKSNFINSFKLVCLDKYSIQS